MQNTDKLNQINKYLTTYNLYITKQDVHNKLAHINTELDKENLWSNPTQATKLFATQKHMQSMLDQFTKYQNEYKQLEECGTDLEFLDTLTDAVDTLLNITKQMYFKTLFQDEYDTSDCFVHIQSGSGGTEAQDWASMLLNMYMKYAQQKQYAVETTQITNGEEAGIKSATIKISGAASDNIHGMLKSEHGTHRLVRMSPFNAQNKRHTSFSSVLVFPVIDDKVQVHINDEDLRIDTYRASGAGGQHVNTTDSAIRITHKPSGIVVQCQNQRSQHKNKAEALKMLTSRLYAWEKNLKAQQISNTQQEKTDITWGTQIRSYVLHPYKMVKDLRTDYTSSNPDAVLNGEIEEFLTAYVESTQK